MGDHHLHREGAGDHHLHREGAGDRQPQGDVEGHCHHLDAGGRCHPDEEDHYHLDAAGHCRLGVVDRYLLDVVDRPDEGGRLDVMNCLDLGERS